MAETNLATERVALLTAQILDDLRGEGYYADPKVLAGIIRADNQQSPQDEENAQSAARVDALRTAARSQNAAPAA